jgi:hypothetical protein
MKPPATPPPFRTPTRTTLKAYAQVDAAGCNCLEKRFLACLDCVFAATKEAFRVLGPADG